MKQLMKFVLLVLMLPVSLQAMEWHQLESMRQAMQQLDYRGEFMHRRGDQTSVYSVVHQYRDGSSSELLRQLDGDMIEVLRTRNKVICYFPQGSEAAASHAIPAAPFSQATQLNLTQISANYQAKGLGQERVAGLNANIIELNSDKWRYKQKLWLDVETNLLLQSEILDSSGHVVEQFRFTRIEVGVPVNDEALISSLEGKPGVMQQVMDKAEPINVHSSKMNTDVSWVPEGFQLMYSEHQMNSQGWVEKRTYSDGLASYSIFAELTHSPTQKSSAMATMGATVALMTQYDALSITVIGEIPVKSAKQIAAHIEVSDF